MIAGFQEQKTGNHFGYSAFASYGAFWIALCLIFMGNHYGVFVSSGTDIGMVPGCMDHLHGLYDNGCNPCSCSDGNQPLCCCWLASFCLTSAISVLPVMNTVAAIVLIGCAFSAWYMMIGVILKDVYGHEILPMGKPWVQDSPAELLGQGNKKPTNGTC